jgi:hypothetical protein
MLDLLDLLDALGLLLAFLCFRGRWSVFVRIFEAMMSRKMQARAALAVAPSSVGIAEP